MLIVDFKLKDKNVAGVAKAQVPSSTYEYNTVYKIRLDIINISISYKNNEWLLAC